MITQQLQPAYERLIMMALILVALRRGKHTRAPIYIAAMLTLNSYRPGAASPISAHRAAAEWPRKRTPTTASREDFIF
jgi:hypothetical protein